MGWARLGSATRGDCPCLPIGARRRAPVPSIGNVVLWAVLCAVVIVRIDALEDLHNPGQFSTKAYIEEDLRLQPEFPAPGLTGPQHHRVWVALDHAWTNRQSADAALEQALSFLNDGTT